MKTNQATRPRKNKPPVLPEVVYPPGWFTAPVRAWKQMRFVSRCGSADKPAPVPQRGRGFDINPLGLAGATPYVNAGPVETMTRRSGR